MFLLVALASRYIKKNPKQLATAISITSIISNTIGNNSGVTAPNNFQCNWKQQTTTAASISSTTGNNSYNYCCQRFQCNWKQHKLQNVYKFRNFAPRMMELKNILQFYKNDTRTQQIVSSSQIMAEARIFLKGLQGSLDAFVAAAVYQSAPKTHIFIIDNKEDAAYFQNDLKNLLEKKSVLFFPDSFKKPGFFDDINKSNVLLRTETATRLIHSHTTGELLVTYPEAFFEKIVNTKILNKNTIHIKREEALDVNFIVEVLVEYGFERTDFVYEPGQFSVRGGIVDIYSFGNELPYRVELFGDEVESIRVFDPLTQLSEKKIAQVTIVPNIQTQFSSTEKTSLFNLLPKNTTIWVKDVKALLEINQGCYEKALRLVENLKQQNLLDENAVFGDGTPDTFIDSKSLLADMQKFSIIEFGYKQYFDKATVFPYNSTLQPRFNKDFTLLIKDLKKREAEGCKNYIFAGNPRQVNRFRHIFEDMEANVKYEALTNSIHQGFIDEDLGITCYTDHQIFGRFYKYNIKRGYSKDKAITIRMLKSLHPGDFVTHIDHGVGKYAGLEKINVNGKAQEVIRIVYRDNDILFVNINSLHKVSKYVGKEGKAPRLNKIGSEAWQNLKRKAKGKIKDIAEDLIKLYAKRKASKGFAYSPDSYLQTEIEASFIYEDTPDQLKATIAVKEDMEAPHPMDRLVCGDVGFGKTEIALRAATKAVADSKQVAILVPTTILALQHYETFKERLKDFPCEVDFLNRFKTAKQKTETLKLLKEGKIDILIGTHALLGKKVVFKELGLLVIDEEQKFGVAAKEKLRNLKVNVDTLTLTATPIPRTLQFSLMSARDLSVMNTPPPNRQPVQTELIAFDDAKIRDAVTYEVYRGGQVFFIHNRVKDLIEITAMIKRLCPDIDIGMAHGQLDNKTLEERMMKFIKGKYDVLVCTNIVESGLDVSNANTIIINNAHHFGLSDLHQLRGRVGRSNRKAFCYLITPPIYTLPDDSRKRLKAIEQFSDLGSGFQIAMRDLDIRGSGNILGGEQSGFISDIGFDMYQKILDEAMQELKETEFKDLFKGQIISEQKFVRDCQLDTDLELHIPDEYVNSINERLGLYTELDNIETEEKLQKFKTDLLDRFGTLPKPVVELFYAVRLRWVAKKLGFERIIFKHNKLRCYFVANQTSPYYQSALFTGVLKYPQQHPTKAHFKQTDKNFLLVMENVKTMKAAREVLLEIEAFAGSMTSVV